MRTLFYRLIISMAAVSLTAGCVSYRADPLHPEAMQGIIDKRSLRDAELRAYVDGGALPSTQTADVWDFDRLLRAAIYYHPELDVARAHILAVQAAQITAGEIPNPTVGFSPSYATKAAGENPWTLGFTFDIPIETAGKRGFRRDEARQLTEGARVALAETVWQVRSRLRAALVEYLLAEQMVEVWEKEVAGREQYVAGLVARLNAGEGGRPAVDIARIDLLTARQGLMNARGIAADDRTKLATALGIAVSGLEGQTFAWPELGNVDPPAPESLDRMRNAALLNRLDLHRSLIEYGAAESALQLQIAKQYPDLHLGPGYTFDQGQNKWELGFSIELPVLNQNGGAIAEAMARRRELGTKFFALQTQALGECESAVARVSSAAAEWHEVQGEIAAIEGQVTASQRALEAGEGDRLALVSAKVQYEVARRLRLDANLKFQAALGALEDAVQRPLSGSTIPLPPAASGPANR